MPTDQIEKMAARWAVRMDAGLTPSEEAELAEWLVADPRHEAALIETQKAWQRFGPLAAQTKASRVPPPRHQRAPIVRFAPQLALAAVAGVMACLFFWRAETISPPQRAVTTTLALPALLEERALEDGSKILLNRGAAVAVAYSAQERRVKLLQGEANFQVEKDPARPFIVTAEGVDIRAVGTAFNVKLDAKAIEVIVTEGKVQVDTDAEPGRPPPPARVTPEVVLEAGQGTTLARISRELAPQVSTLSSEDIDTRLAWRPRLLDYDDASLADIVAEFNRRNAVHLVVADRRVGALRLTASFRSDNVQGFVRLLEANFGISAERRSEAEIVLRHRGS